jgi:hypothetical protein
MIRKIFEFVAFVALFVIGGLYIAYLVNTAFGQANPPSWTRSAPATDTGYPPGAQPFVITGTGTTTATATTAQPAAYQNSFLCTLVMTEAGGTGITVNGSITNTINGTVTFSQLGQLVVTFTPCLPNNGSNMVITAPTSTAATASSIVATGFYY